MEKPALDTLLKSINEDSSLNSLIQSSPVCHKIFDPDFKLKFMSSSGVNALQIKNVEEMYGQFFPTNAAPKATRDIFMETLSRAAKGETNTIEYSFEVDGSTIWYRTSISPFFNSDGDLIYIKADSMDITDIIVAEEKNRTLLETSDICFKEIHKNEDSSYTMTFMSEAGRRLLGIDNIEELFGKPYPLDIYPGLAQIQMKEAMEKVFESGKQTQVECEGFDKKGNSVWYLSTISVHKKNKNGEVVSVTISSQDVTEQVKTRVALAKAKESAERASLAKSEFLSRMSHEFRTPLNAIMGFSQLMAMDAKTFPNEQLQNLESISVSSKHLLRLINDILDLAQIESGKSRVSIVPVSIEEILKDLIVLAKPITKENNTNLTYIKKEGSELPVMADKTRLKQVLLNLISNAIKYNRENGHVEISVEEIENNRLRVSVKDTGPGISEEMQENLFEPFNRLGAEFTQTQGTGIGLSISKHLMDLMGGDIGFTTAIDKGSCFYIDLPISENPIEVPQEAEEKDKKQLSKKLPRQNFKILYIEDKPDNLELIRQSLKHRKNIDVMAAPDAKLGIDMAKVQPPDLILMDINLPGMDGIEAHKILAGDPKTSSIPVMAVSANAMEKDIHKSMEAGFVDYITKPVDIPIFLEKIDKFIK